MPTITIYDSKTHQELEVVSRKNYDSGSYYLPSITVPRSVYNGSICGQYNGALPSYYPMISKPHDKDAKNINVVFSAPFLATDKVLECYVYSTEGDVDYYAPVPKKDNSFVFKEGVKPEEITIEDITATEDGVVQTVVPRIVNFSYIQKHYLATHDVGSIYYYKDTTSYRLVNGKWHDKTFIPSSTLKEYIVNYAFVAATSEEADELTMTAGQDINNNGRDESSSYTKTIPSPTLAYKGPVYNEQPSADGKKISLIRVNEKG